GSSITCTGSGWIHKRRATPRDFTRLRQGAASFHRVPPPGARSRSRQLFSGPLLFRDGSYDQLSAAFFKEAGLCLSLGGGDQFFDLLPAQGRSIAEPHETVLVS